MKRSLRRCVCLLAVLAVASCGSPTEPVASGEPGIRTVGTVFTMIPEGEGRFTGHRVTIPYEFTNRTGQQVSILNCNRHVVAVLERKVGRRRWEHAWGGITLDCLSPPVVIDDGARITETFSGSGVLPGTPNVSPHFDPIPGTYRLRWTRGFTSYNHDGPPWGNPLPEPHALSNEFELVLD